MFSTNFAWNNLFCIIITFPDKQTDVSSITLWSFMKLIKESSFQIVLHVYHLMNKDMYMQFVERTWRAYDTVYLKQSLRICDKEPLCMRFFWQQYAFYCVYSLPYFASFFLLFRPITMFENCLLWNLGHILSNCWAG